MPLINVNQIDQNGLTLLIQQTASGAALSGSLLVYVNASGYLGPNVVYTTGGAQLITGIKTFGDSPIVPSGGATPTAANKDYVLDRVNSLSGYLGGSFVDLTANQTISGRKIFTGAVGVGYPLQSGDAANLGYVSGVSGTLSAVKVTGGALISSADFTGLGGTLVIHSGGKIFISGAAAGGGAGGTGSNVSVTGSSAIASPNFSGIGSVVLSYNGTLVLVSGTASADASLSGYVEGNFVHRGPIDEIISGLKTFTGNPLVASPSQPSGVVNLAYLSGVSGAIVAGNTTIVNNTFNITGTGVIAASSNASGNITNTFSITSGNTYVTNSGSSTSTFYVTGDLTATNQAGSSNTFNTNGTVSSPINLSGITGNFVNISFFFDQNNLSTGLALIEGFVSRDFYFTGYGLGVYNSGTQGLVSGSIYQRTTTNAKVPLTTFTLNSGVFFYASGGFSNVISGMNRVGIDITRIGTGFTGLSVGVFGVGY